MAARGPPATAKSHASRYSPLFEHLELRKSETQKHSDYTAANHKHTCGFALVKNNARNGGVTTGVMVKSLPMQSLLKRARHEAEADDAWTVEEVTREEDLGYEADVELRFPDGFEDGETEEDNQSASDTSSSLADQFRQLHCDAGAKDYRNRGSGKDRHRSRATPKRRHSQVLSSNSSCENMLQTPSNQFSKRQRRCFVGQLDDSPVVRLAFDDHMDIDEVKSRYLLVPEF